MVWLTVDMCQKMDIAIMQKGKSKMEDVLYGLVIIIFVILMIILVFAFSMNLLTEAFPKAAENMDWMICGLMDRRKKK